MEHRFGRNFEDVRVHDDGSSAEAAHGIQAHAFTMGRDIYFGRDRYQPHSSVGQKLLAHELTHVLQQRRGAVQTSPKSIFASHEDALEREAEQVEAHVEKEQHGVPARLPVSGDASQSHVVQRKCACGGSCASCSGEQESSPVQRKAETFENDMQPAQPAIQRKCACGGTCSKCSGSEEDHGHPAVQRSASGAAPAKTARGPGYNASEREAHIAADEVSQGREVSADKISSTEATGIQALDWDWCNPFTDPDCGISSTAHVVAGETQEIASEVWDEAKALASAIGGVLKYINNLLTITISPRHLFDALALQVALPELGLDLPFLAGAVPVAPGVEIYGELGVHVGVTPELGLQLGPCDSHEITLALHPLTLSGEAKGGFDLTLAGSLAGEVHAGLFGEVGVILEWPDPPIILEVPIAHIEAGLAGLARGTLADHMSVDFDVAAGIGGFSFDLSKHDDFGLGLDLGAAGYGALSVLGQNLCTLYWPLYQKHMDTVLSMGFSFGMSASDTSLPSLSVGVESAHLDEKNWDDLGIELQRDMFKDDCPLCDFLYGLGLMPSQRGGSWTGHPEPAWPDGPLSVYPRAPRIKSGALCRGACGADCETCTHEKDHRECEENGNGCHSWWVYSNYEVCGTHSGCRNHDACYDWCADKYNELGKLGIILGPCHRLCDLECVCDYNLPQCVGWIGGGTPHDGQMTYSDAPKKVPGCRGPCPHTEKTPGGPAQEKLCLPDVTVIDRRTALDWHWADKTPDIIILTLPLKIPYIPPARLDVFVRGEARASVNAGVGPVTLERLCLIYDPRSHAYSGTGSLHLKGDLNGAVALTGIVGATAGWGCLLNAISLEVVRGEAGLTASAFAKLPLDLYAVANVSCRDGKLTLDLEAWFKAVLDLYLRLDASLRVLLFRRFEVFSDTWKLADKRWGKEWNIPIGVTSGEIGGSPCGGGTAAGVLGLPAPSGPPPALAAVGAGAGPATAPAAPAAPSHLAHAELGRIAGINIKDMVTDMFRLATGREVVNDETHGKLPADPAKESGQKNPCGEDVKPDDQCGSKKLPLSRVPVRETGSHGQGKTMKSSPLTKCVGDTVGSRPDPSAFFPPWECIRQRKQTKTWVHAHLLHGATPNRPAGENLHGPGDQQWNLIISDRRINRSMAGEAEELAIRRIFDKNEVLWYQSEVKYISGGGDLDYFAESITVSFGKYNTDTGQEEQPALFAKAYPRDLSKIPPSCPPGTQTPAPGAPDEGDDSDTVQRSPLPFSLGGVQRQLKVGAVADPAEHEANRVADQLVSGSGSQPTISRLPQVQKQESDTSEAVQRRFIGQTESEEPVRRKAKDHKGGDLDAAAHHAVSTKGAGEPLRPAVRKHLEPRMGADLSGVRVHEGTAARESAAALDARAFTHKSDIWLGQGESQDNTHLMAHEVTHVIQQGAAPQASATSSSAVSLAGPEGLSSAPSPPTLLSASTKTAPAAPGKPTGKKPSGDTAALIGTPTRGEEGAPARERKKLSPGSDPAFAAVVKNVKTVAKHQRTHEPKEAKVAQAHAAVESRDPEKFSYGAKRQIDQVPEKIEKVNEKTPKPFDRKVFTDKLIEKIEKTTPKTLEEADNVKDNPKVSEIKTAVHGEVEHDKTTAQGPEAEIADKNPELTGIANKDFSPLVPVVPGSAPHIAAAGAAPKAAADEDISLQAGPKEIDQQMADSEITEEQLRDSNEPEFQSVLDQKKDVEKQAVAAPAAFRAQEPALLHSAQVSAQTVANKDALVMHGIHTQAFGEVHTEQTEAKTDEESKRVKIYSDVKGMYETTKGLVEKRLRKLDTDVNKAFDEGAKASQDNFEYYIDFHMSEYKWDRYSTPLIGAGLWLKDKVKGLPHEVDVFYQKGHDLYVRRMREVIDNVAGIVETGLNEARKIIDDGKAEIERYLAGLDPASQEAGKTAAKEIQDDFNSLEQSIVDKQDELVDSLAKKYNDNLQKINARIEEMKEANKGLVDKVIGAVKGVIEAIAHLKDLLLDVLSRAASAIGTIIAHPIRFLGNLVDAGMLGFNNFRKNIVEHLKEGFMQWLFGAVAKTGIELPNDFDLPGILSLVLQLLGLTYANIRARAVNIVGENVVKTLETTAEIFKVLITKGPGGLWEYMQDKLGNILDTAIESIKSFVMEKIIIAGVTWLIGLLNPASAFIKACKAIYDIVMFFVERGSQILDLVNAIIDSITAIASGNIDKAADFIEKSLARAIPVIIGFLASLLGVDGISEKIQKIIDTIRKPINEAIDWVIGKAVTLAKAAGGLLMAGGMKIGGAVKKVKNLLFPSKHFEANGEDHTVTAAPKGEDDYDIVIHSETLGIESFIKFAKKKADDDSIKGVDKQLDKLNKLHTAWKAIKVYPDDAKDEKKKEELYLKIFNLIAAIWKKVGDDDDVPESVILWGPLDSKGRATEVTADPLTKKGPAGSGPKAEIPGWKDEKPGKRSDEGRIRAHLLHYALHGPGEAFNLTPTSNSVNALMYTRVESYALEALSIRKDAAGGKVPKAKQLKYETKVTYNDRLPGKNKYFAKTVTMNVFDKKTGKRVGEHLHEKNQ